MARSSLPFMLSSDGYAELNVGKIRYPVRIQGIEHNMEGTFFEGYVLSPAEQYIRNGIAATKSMINSIFGSSKGITIEKVIFNPPATIVLWSDGTKTVVKAQGYDEYDPEKGLAMAICKKVMGNKGNYNNEINKWTDQYWEKRNEEVDWFPDITEFLHCSPDEAVAKFKKEIDELLYKKIFNKPESDVK